MTKQLHLVKLSVGSEGIEGLRAWQASAPAQGPDGLPRHITRMWPQQEKQLLDGGSIYWVIKRFIQCRREADRKPVGMALKSAHFTLPQKPIMWRIITAVPIWELPQTCSPGDARRRQPCLEDLV